MKTQGSGDVVLVTGATNGLGKACAEHLAARGYRVYGTGRKPSSPEAGGVILLSLDVTDDQSVRKAVREILDREGRIDAVVCNAGYGIAGPVEETPLAEAKSQFETNFFGTLRTIQAVLPSMRAAGRGRVLVVGSMAGLAGVPYQSLYSAAKFALEGLVEALRLEMKAFGIRCAIVEPGDHRTGFTDARKKSAAPGSPYAAAMERSLGAREKEERNGSDPADMARLVERLLRTDRLRVRYMVGPGFQKLAMTLKRVLPSRTYEWIMSSYYRI